MLGQGLKINLALTPFDSRKQSKHYVTVVFNWQPVGQIQTLGSFLVAQFHIPNIYNCITFMVQRYYSCPAAM